jgi:hypothetical protein
MGGMTEAEALLLDPTLWDRATAYLWGRVEETPSGCWEYQGYKNPHNGYGTFSLWVRGGKKSWTFYAHRVAYADAYGEVPPSQQVLHDCDNPACCNPVHLFLGTQADNMADMNAKGRHIKGEDANFAKLTEEQALEIIRRAAEGERHKPLSVEFGVNTNQISRIVRGVRWAHLPRPPRRKHG